jgi:hypothetical protein
MLVLNQLALYHDCINSNMERVMSKFYEAHVTIAYKCFEELQLQFEKRRALGKSPEEAKRRLRPQIKSFMRDRQDFDVLSPSPIVIEEKEW